MKKLLLILALSSSLHAQAGKPVPPPQAVCTAGVNADECKEITGLLSVFQQVTLPARIVQFVIADDASYGAENQRLISMANNRIDAAPKNSNEQIRALTVPDFFSSFVSLFEINSSTRIISKVYFNETAACHKDPKISKTDAYDSQACETELFYALGFLEGAFLGQANAVSNVAAGH